MNVPVLIALPLLFATQSLPADAPAALDAIHVSARSAQPVQHSGGAVTRIEADAIARIAPQHAQELFARVPGTWASRGSGQEQLLAIRSPVLAGTGACGAFLILEQGIPIRPSGFCNVNQLFELPLELAAAIEVLRGPGTAVHGSNALHGVIDLRAPALDAPTRAALRMGSFDYVQALAGLSGRDATRPFRIDASATDSGSFRADEGHAQQRLLAQFALPQAAGAPHFLLSLQALDQDTAGYITGDRAFADARRRLNPNPEAYRRAQSARLSGRWGFTLEAGELSITPYARSDSGEFIQHFILGKPIEQNGSDSLGLQLGFSALDGALRSGLDLEFAHGDVRETQPMPLTSGTPAQNATRPAGRHYDYRVRSDSAAAFVQWDSSLGALWSLQSGTRIESIAYRYDNRMSSGNLSDDGSVCDFGGCLFQRPEDRSDRFTRPTAHLGVLRVDEHGRRVFLRAATAFRAPQAGELYRLQRGQELAELGPERAESIELGGGLPMAGGRIEAVAYAMDKRGSIFRDAAGFNVGDGRSRHVGVELDIALPLPGRVQFDANLAWSEQTYRFERSLGGGETIHHGNRIDTAPEWLGGLRLRRAFDRMGAFEVEWQHQGGYFADAGNTFFHSGHDLLHLRWARELTAGWQLTAAVRNLGNIRYAERADFGFGERRYFPGAPRSYVVGLEWREPR